MKHHLFKRNMSFLAIKPCSGKQMYKTRREKPPEVMFRFLSLCLMWGITRPDQAAIPPPNPTAWLLWDGRLEGDWEETAALNFKPILNNVELVLPKKLCCVTSIQTLETEYKSPKAQPGISIKHCMYLQQVLWKPIKILLKRLRCLKWES